MYHMFNEDFPEDIMGDLADLVAWPDLGQVLTMPTSRPMP
jgi:hypothetical protein